MRAPPKTDPDLDAIGYGFLVCSPPGKLCKHELLRTRLMLLSSGRNSNNCYAATRRGRNSSNCYAATVALKTLEFLPTRLWAAFAQTPVDLSSCQLQLAAAEVLHNEQRRHWINPSLSWFKARVQLR